MCDSFLVSWFVGLFFFVLSSIFFIFRVLLCFFEFDDMFDSFLFSWFVGLFFFFLSSIFFIFRFLVS